MLRTAEGLGISRVYLTGYTPYPAREHDDRLPHLAQSIDRQIRKTALGAEALVPWDYHTQLEPILAELRSDGYVIAALEQQEKAFPLPKWQAPTQVALIVGREVDGIEPEILELADQVIEIPMQGHKESFNVASAAAMALYHLTYVA